MRKMLRYGRELASLTRRHGWRRATSRLRGTLAHRSGLPMREEVQALAAAIRDLQRELERERQRGHTLESQLARHSEAVRWLAEQNGMNGQPVRTVGAEGPLISVIMPVRNGEATVGDAIESVLHQTYEGWELILVDDHSHDATAEILREYGARDSRIWTVPVEGAGVSAARNAAVHAARGELVSYLDADNTWFPSFLDSVVACFHQHPQTACAFAGQLVERTDNGFATIRGCRYDREQFLAEGGIDLNAFVHRRELVTRYGGFDETMNRLVDWDLIARYTADAPSRPIPVIAGRYVEEGGGSISATENFAYHRYRLHRQWERPLERELRVLYMVWDFPQLTESYVRWEIECMRRWGVHVEVWTERHDTNAPFDSRVPVHTGSLQEAVRCFRPHVAHAHWLHYALMHRDELAGLGVPLTVRGHGFEFHTETVNALLRDPAVQGIFLFPHFARMFPGYEKLHACPAAVNGDLFYPPAEKDRTLVVRTASAKATKGLETFVQVAARCPEHQFVLVLGRINSMEEYVGEIQRYNESLGSPVDIRINVPAEETASIVRRAGIYLHTYGDEEPFGMPVSIAEAMATGALTLVRDLPGAADYVGQGGRLYRTVEDAVTLIWHSRSWPHWRWRELRRRAVDQAFGRHADNRVLRPLLEQWLGQCEARSDLSLVPPREEHIAEWLEVLKQEGRAHERGFHDNTYLAHLLGILRMLRVWGADDEICGAGLFHAAYVPPDPMFDISQRPRIREIVGARAEHLAYCHCAVRHEQLETAFRSGQAPFRMPDRLGGGTLELDARDFRDLCRIELADFLEKAPRVPDWEAHALFLDVARMLGPREVQSFERVRQVVEAMATPAAAPVPARAAA